MTTVPELAPAADLRLEAATHLRREQERLAALLAGLPPAAWDARPDGRARAALVATGHFPEYAGELDWCAREVAGHLRDSARVFATRIGRLLAGDEGPFEDFDPLAPGRVTGYRGTSAALLLADLAAAQEELLRTVSAVRPDDLRRSARRAGGRPVTVADLLRFLPTHQADHAAQLALLSAAAEVAR